LRLLSSHSTFIVIKQILADGLPVAIRVQGEFLIFPNCINNLIAEMSATNEGIIQAIKQFPFDLLQLNVIAF